MLLEVIAKDVRDIEIINNSKANRIEFCKELTVGGLTPEKEDIIRACEISKLPLNIMVRNTYKDFFYNKKEKNEMLEQVEFISKTKANGIVIGSLNKDLTIDVEFLKEVIKIKKNLEITFHKAFDEVEDFELSYKVLNELGITNVLTSGGKDILKGKEVIKNLVSLNLNTKILIGGGVNQENFLELNQISKDIHVGTCVRDNSSWDEPVNSEKIDKLLEN
ncbi:copper homeostasis protein CutC [Spiroplasma monobiae]|uniref:Copper homeostasis protein cutC homolog n=1 Tax=Spiroplasma monobiae MQ-1 TaxID=1336748 RepID=A0A2K9LV20_SPISQ|nr:copper homeostasis protein CutC [Spiroplasma monobiae]AUM62883.1 copper homeostasis protein [Spiroplasma monobiae MQ-1]